MDRYKRVEKPRAADSPPISENEIRITSQGRMRNYISYATTLLQDKGSSEIVLKAMGRTINKAVMVCEIIKRRVAGLHQNTVIGSADITDTWEPLEEGLLLLETTRHVSMIAITLSTKELDEGSAGYQPPLPLDQVKPLVEFEYEPEMSPQGGRGGRSRGRGRGRGRSIVVPAGEYYGMDRSWSRGRPFRGRGRVRGRSFRGRGGGYDRQQDTLGYEDALSGEISSRGQGTWLSGRGRVQRRMRGRGRGLMQSGGTAFA